jgi:hypothetical protein
MIFPLSDLTPTVSFLRAACFWLNTGSRVFPAGKTPDGISASEAITYGYQSADFGRDLGRRGALPLSAGRLLEQSRTISVEHAR